MDSSNKFEQIRQRTVDRLLLVSMIVSIPAAMFSGYRIVLMGYQPGFVADMMLAVLLIVINILHRQISYKIRIVVLIIYVFLLGTVSLNTFGLFGLGMFMLFFTGIIVTVIFGLRYGILLLVCSFLVILYFILAVEFGWISFTDFDFNMLSVSPFQWIVRAVFFLSFSAIAIITLGLTHSNLERINIELVESEARFRQLSDLTFEGLLIHRDGVIVDVNQAMCRMLGFSQGELIGVNLFTRIAPEKFPTYAIENFKSDRSAPFELNLLRKDGTLFPFEIEGKTFYKDNEKFRAVAIRDISERKKAENDLQLSEKRYLTLFEQVNDTIFILNGDVIVDCNAKTPELFKTDRNTIIGMHIYELSPEFQPDGMRSAEKAGKILNSMIHQTSQRFEWEHKRPDGTTFDTEVSLSLLAALESSMVLAIVRDTTERNRFEKRMLNAITETEEKERIKLAGDLHDEVGPLLSSLNMYLSLINRDETNNKPELLITMQGILKESINSVREISNNLSPHLLLNYGLVAALKHTIEIKNKLVEISFEENIGNRRFSGNIEVALYRIVKELLNNTLKYANAQKILINLFAQNDSLTLLYRDDGEGFDSKELLNQEHKGIGLLNIINRVNAINGRYLLESKAGEGFSMLISVKIE